MRDETMWTDPAGTLEDARRRQAAIEREVAANRVQQPNAPAFADVLLTWAIALQTTGDFVRCFRQWQLK